tara:strand:- start:151 stop:483 length:333 start_codon:yes stop_codon:yes gene_type:complete
MTKKKKYFPNNWKKWKDTPPEFFGHILPTFDEFMDWKLGGYELPSSVACIIREEDATTGKIKEYVYSRHADARRKAADIIRNENGFVIVTEDACHHVYPELTEDYDDPLA